MQPQPLLTLLSCIWLWLISSVSVANTPILMPEGSFDYAISPYVSIYEDDTKQLTIDEIVTLKYQLFFTPSHAQALKLGISDSNFWFRFSVSNPFDKPIDAIFTLSDSDIDLLNIYRIDGNNRFEPIPDTHPSRAIHGGMLQFFTLQISAPPHHTSTYLMQLHSTGLLTTHMALLSQDNFIANEQHYFMLLGVCLGLMSMVILGFGYIWLKFRLPIALACIGFCLVIMIYQCANLGYLRLFWGMSAFHADKLAEFSLGLTYFMHIMASVSLQWQGPHAKLIKRTLMSMAVLAIPTSVFFITLFSQGAMPSIALMLVVNSFLVASILLFAKSHTPTSQNWLLLSNLLLGLSVLTVVLTSYNLLSFGGFSAWAEMIIPVGILTALMAATLYQLPDHQQHTPKLTNELSIGSKLLSQISQDLRTPINSVIGINELLNDSPLSPQQREFSNTIASAGHELLHVVNQAADVSRLHDHQFELELQPLNLAALLNDVLASLQQEAERKQIELILDINDNLPAYVQADYHSTYTIIRNIIAHALVYIDNTDLCLQVNPYGNGNFHGIRMQIMLTSTLVRPEVLRTAFSIFKPMHYSTIANKERQWQLLLTRSLLLQMQGQLDIESMTSQGASLNLLLPLSSSPDPSPATSNFSNLSGRRILIVDDSASLRSVLERQVKRWGMKADSTFSGKEALARLRNQINLGEPYDLMIIDHDMPIMTGIQLAERVQQDHAIIHKPALLMLTGQTVSSLRDEAQGAGIGILLAKPVNTEHLLHALLELLASKTTPSKNEQELS